MRLFKNQLVGFLLLLPLFSYSQVLDFIDIHLTVLERVGNTTHALSNAVLNISDEGKVVTDSKGTHTYTYALRNKVNPEISISLISEEHKMLKPLDGSIMVDPTREKMYIEFLVINTETESPAFKKRISELERKVSSLKNKNELTKQQLNKMYETLLDTVFYYEGIKTALEAEVVSVKGLNEEQKRLIEEQQAKIRDLEAKVDQLTEDISAALEEKYLRQNEYFKDISANLREYLRTSKDIRDHLPNIKTYYNSTDGFKGLDRDLNLYNKVYAEMDDKHLAFLEGVDHYWNNDLISRELEDLFDLIIKGIHLNQIFPVVNNILDQLRKQKPVKAQKAADEAYDDLVLNINDLEKKVNHILINLRNN